MTNSIWTPSSWREKPIVQQPQYEDLAALNNAEARLGKMPPGLCW